MEITFEDIVSRHEWTLVEWWADWCTVCKGISKMMATLAKEYEHRVKIMPVNIADEREAAAQNLVRSLPTFTLFMNGKSFATKVGVVGIEDMRKWLDKQLNFKENK